MKVHWVLWQTRHKKPPHLLGHSKEIKICKVEFIQSFCWLYFVPNLLVIQHLETLYLGGNHIRVVCERV